MPAKYSHVKKRTQKNASSKKIAQNTENGPRQHGHHHRLPGSPNPHVDRGITQAMTAVAKVERTISRILLLRYEQDIARLFSTRLYTIALVHLPTFVMRCVSLGGPGWAAHNYDSEEIKDFFRAVISMDMRQAGERVATKSILWSYTALRHFASSNNVPICQKRGLHSVRLIPHYDALKAHLDSLEAMPPPTFSKPPHLGTLQEGQAALEEACEIKFGLAKNKTKGKNKKGKQSTLDLLRDQAAHSLIPPEWSFKDSSDPTALGSPDSTPEQEAMWKLQVRMGYERVVQTLWRVAKEFDVRGYGTLLREKLTTKWCDCGCSTDHLGEVCEKTVREDEDDRRRYRERGSGRGKDAEKENGEGRSKNLAGKGKQREWDGRGSGVYGWDTQEEEDIWEVELDFGGVDPRELDDGVEPDMTISEVMELKYLKAERAKEEGNQYFRKGVFDEAVKCYETAHKIEPELPHYQLNLAAAHLKLSNWIEAENACTKALGQHRSSKGLFRRAKARRMLGKEEEAARDLRIILRTQPTNAEARAELMSLLKITPGQLRPQTPRIWSSSMSGGSSRTAGSSSSGGSSSQAACSSSSSSRPPPGSSEFDEESSAETEEDRLLGITKPKPSKPLPFAKTAADDRKLKIVLFPASFDSKLMELAALFGGPPPSPCDFGSFGPGYSPAFNAGFGNGYGGPTGNGNGYASGLGFGANPHTNEHGKNGAGIGNGKGRHLGRCRCGRSHSLKKGEWTKEDEAKLKERIENAKKRQKDMEKLRNPNVTYPSWERYIVKKAD